ncbi:MAG: hypothetical protein ACRC7C_19650 [Beijerinckiaceae bacterium]
MTSISLRSSSEISALAWSAISDGNPVSGQPINGVLSENAAYFSAREGVRLTTTTAQSGALTWSTSAVDFVNRNFEFGANVFMNADADGVGLTVGGNLKGECKTYINDNVSAFSIGGVAVGQQIPEYFDPAGSWRKMRMVVTKTGTVRTALLYIDDVLFNSLNVTSWIPNGVTVSVSARTGGAGNIHYVRSAMLTYW